MSNYRDLFQYCYNSNGEAQIRVNEYIILPEKLDTRKRITWYDESAARAIADMESYIAMLKEYRADLAKRYAELSAMPYTMRLELKRDKRYQGPVYYHLKLLKVYQDGHTEPESSTTYHGTERHKAIAAFEAMKKQRPGIEAVKDIAKGKWER